MFGAKLTPLAASDQRADSVNPDITARRSSPEKNSAAELELAHCGRCDQPGSLTVADIAYVFTISQVAEILGEDEAWLREISTNMDPEEG